MRKGLLALVIILPLLLVISGCAIFFVNRETKNSENNSSTITLVHDEGKVFVKIGTQEFSEIAAEESQIPNDAIVKTTDGTAHVIFPDNSVMTIDTNTQVQINYGDKSTDIFQFFGNTWHRVEKLVGAREYNVDTASTQATVRGTKFGVKNEENGSVEVFVTESEVAVRKIIDRSKKKYSQDEKVVKSGKIGKGSNEKEFTVEDIPTELKDSKWFRFNSKFDNAFDKLRNEKKLKKDFIEEAKKMNKLEEFRKERTATPSPDVQGMNDEASPTPESTVTPLVPQPTRPRILPTVIPRPTIRIPVPSPTPAPTMPKPISSPVKV